MYLHSLRSSCSREEQFYPNSRKDFIYDIYFILIKFFKKDSLVRVSPVNEISVTTRFPSMESRALSVPFSSGEMRAGARSAIAANASAPRMD